MFDKLQEALNKYLSASGASLECGDLSPLWYSESQNLQRPVPKRWQVPALQGGARRTTSKWHL